MKLRTALFYHQKENINGGGIIKMKREYQEDEDYLWELILDIKAQYRYETRLVTDNMRSFAPFIMIVIPTKPGMIGYIAINAEDLCRVYELMGKKAAKAQLMNILDAKLENFRKRYGDI